MGDRDVPQTCSRQLPRSFEGTIPEEKAGKRDCGATTGSHVRSDIKTVVDALPRCFLSILSPRARLASLTLTAPGLTGNAPRYTPFLYK